MLCSSHFGDLHAAAHSSAKQQHSYVEWKAGIIKKPATELARCEDRKIKTAQNMNRILSIWNIKNLTNYFPDQNLFLFRMLASQANINKTSLMCPAENLETGQEGLEKT